MEGGGATESFVLGDLGDYKNVDDMAPIASGALVGLNLVAALARFGGIGGISLNTYFDSFGLEGILLNVSYVTLLFQVARWAYTCFYSSGDREWSPFVFVCIVMGMQFVNDLIFYYGPLSIVPNGKNDMIDILKRYVAENGSRVLAGHALFLIFVAVIAMFIKESSTLFTYLVIAISLYTLPLLLTTVGPKPPPPPPKADEKKATTQVEPRWGAGAF